MRMKTRRSGNEMMNRGLGGGEAIKKRTARPGEWH
jgi:hypothetical protein